MFVKKLLLLCVCLAAAVPLVAQTPSAPPSSAPHEFSSAKPPRVPEGAPPQYLWPETPEQRKIRLGTAEDPGPDPDPKQHFIRFGKSYHIERFDRRWENWDGQEVGFVRPFGFVNVPREVYQLDNKWIWVWMPDPEPSDTEPVPQPPASRYTEAQVNYFESMRPEFSELSPEPSDKTIVFEEASAGLPTSGSWRNSVAVADMNGDGCPDIIAPPQRQGNGIPSIFLGDCKGNWKFWSTVKWPLRIDYGNVVAADFNKDGHMDLAFGVHQIGIAVMLGDGKGNFTAVTKGLPRTYPTRRIAVADVDRDGYPDIVALGEAAAIAAPSAGKIRAYLNRSKGTAWEALDVIGPDELVAGDWLTIASLQGKSSIDFVASTTYMNSNDTLFINNGSKKWKSVDADPSVLPVLGLYYATAAGKFSARSREDAILSFVRYWPTDLDKTTHPDPAMKAVVGLDRVSFDGPKVKRTPIVRWASDRPILGLASADFDGDGHPDLIYTRFDPREAVILLGDGRGGFRRANIKGLKVEPNTNYDVVVDDVNGDGRPDVILMYESSGSTRFAVSNGSIHVFLNRGVAAGAASVAP